MHAFEHWFDYFDQFDEMEEFIKDIRVKDINFICCLIAQCNFINIINQNLFFNILKSFIHLQNIKNKTKFRYLSRFLSRYHLKANECLFVDDLKENIDSSYKSWYERLCLSSKYTRVRKI